MAAKMIDYDSPQPLLPSPLGPLHSFHSEGRVAKCHCPRSPEEASELFQENNLPVIGMVLQDGYGSKSTKSGTPANKKDYSDVW